MPEINIQVGELIRSTRLAKNLTQKELGAKVDVSESMINKYESGKQNPTIKTLAKILDGLGARLILKVEDK